MKNTIYGVLRQFYRILLGLYPSNFRDEFGEEMTSIFATSVAEANHQGPRALVRLCLKELLDLPASLAVAYWSEFTYKEVIMHRKADWIIWPSWVVLHLLSMPLAVLLMLAIVIVVNGIAVPFQEWTKAQGLQLLALLLGFAVVTGTLQWFLLRRYLSNGISWGITTTLGWLVGALWGYGVWLIADSLAFSNNLVVVAGSILIGFGFIVGTFQYLVLRPVIKKASGWIAASAIAYSSLILLVAQPVSIFSFLPIISIFWFLFLISLPAIITGVVLFQLLQQAEVSVPYPVETGAQLSNAPPIKGKRKRAWVAAGILTLILFCLVAPLVWTVGQLTLAKADGIYATPEEAMTATIMNNSGGYEIERIDLLSAGPNYPDGRLPHVWFVGANVYGDYRPDGKSTAPKGYWGAGSFHIKVAEGWVHVPEGAFPGLMGRVMAWYGLEGCCSTE